MSLSGADIPMLLMDHHDPILFADLMTAVETVASTGAFTGGEPVESFEADYAAWCGSPHAVGVSSGTAALTLALRSLGIGRGDEVLVPANSFIATAEAVTLAGARPRFADVDEDTQLLTAGTVERAMTAAVRCLIPVHLFGRTVDMGPIMELARGAGISVVEDASQAHGARYRGRTVGTVGDVGAFSCYPAKNLGAWGDAGVLVTARSEVAERVRLLRSHGESPRYHHRLIGTTARLDAIQAAILRVKLKRLTQMNAARQRAAAGLRSAFAGAENVMLPPPAAEDGDHVYHQFVVRVGDRDHVKAKLASQGIASAVHYPIAIHRSEAYRSISSPEDVAPCATRLSGEILSLPIFPAITDEQIERIASTLRQCVEGSAHPQAMALG